MNKKPIYKRVTALVTAACTVAVMCGLPAFAFAEESGAAGVTGVTKEETVYIVTDSTGTQQDVIVSDHLQNKGKVKTIADETNLSDIENVKGEETFKQNGDALTWDAEGNSIYYQGKSENEVPVAMDVVYRLDGKVVSGSELQGQSGRVEIKINYQNDAEYKGTTVPFIVMTGIVVTDDSFKNIKIDHGKVIDDGDKLLVVGMAAPGLAQTLDIGETDLGIGSSVTITGDADKFAVEDMMTVVTNSVFEDVDTDKLDDLDYDDEIKQLDKGAKALVKGSKQLYDGLETVSDNMPALENGVGALNEGADKLNKGTKSAQKGAGQLKSGSKELQKGVSPLIDGLGTAAQGIAALKQGSAQELAGLKQIQTGLNGTEETPAPADALAQVQTGLDSISGQLSGKSQDMEDAAEAAKQLSAYMEQVNSIVNKHEKALRSLGYGKLVDQTSKANDAAEMLSSGLESAPEELTKAAGGINTASGGVGKVKDGIKKIQFGVNGDGTEANPGLVAGMTSIDNGLGELNSKFSTIAQKTGALNTGVNALVTGASQLKTGEDQLATGAQQLANGMEALQNKSDTLIDGVDRLDRGSYKLSKGMSTLYKDGIKKIVDLYNDDLKGTLDSADAMIDAGKGYKTFTKLPAGMDGNVKFIYKTDITD